MSKHPSAYVKHQLPGRVRLKIPQKKGDADYFARIAKSFSKFPGITQLQFNPNSGTILIRHDEAKAQLGNISEFAQTNGLFNIAEPPPEKTFSIPHQPIATLTSTRLNRLDQSLMELSEGLIDSRSLFLLILTGLAVHQIARGKIMTPAASLLWGAVELLREESIAR
ncbi:HMA2 domain-containing protein [Candidatus Methylobacter oryzae]|uniref:Heavy-metal-associated domain-containing protein n=1 Tax=Candidatus Methylobacter oryzae TaxID=2497749 RepID=A0ABY3C4U1_9GAMM|nr:hypothetical protein [Candidatus Methylobacter oryzae]TRW89544.1 hypothetical protein EKO24_021005 [Candidatus Methylobacter oryzae]